MKEMPRQREKRGGVQATSALTGQELGDIVGTVGASFRHYRRRSWPGHTKKKLLAFLFEMQEYIVPSESYSVLGNLQRANGTVQTAVSLLTRIAFREP